MARVGTSTQGTLLQLLLPGQSHLSQEAPTEKTLRSTPFVSPKDWWKHVPLHYVPNPCRQPLDSSSAYSAGYLQHSNITDNGDKG